MSFREYTLLTLLLLASAAPAAQAGDVIKIGDLNSYKAMVANTQPYRKGLDLAIAEANAAGGVIGKKIEMIYRDDGANPNEAVRAADELILREDARGCKRNATPALVQYF